MAERNPNVLLRQLIERLRGFVPESKKSSLREKVIELIPAFKKLRALGAALSPINSAERVGAKKRILDYFLQNPSTLIRHEEIMIISGISEAARRVRELRVQDGWKILSGETIKAMADAGEIELSQGSRISPNDYMLVSSVPDSSAAGRWNMANKIRKEKGASAKQKILKFFQSNVGIPLQGDELQYVANGQKEWARRVRELRTEEGWPISTTYSGRQDLPTGVYVLERNRQSPAHDRKIADAIRSAVLKRDGYRCTNCGWSHEMWNPSDPRHLEPHHIRHHARGGGNEADNLRTLCTVCHDEVHAKERYKK